MNYLFDPDYLADKTETAIAGLRKNKPGADFTEFAAGVIYERLKANIQRYRVYGVYWYALKDVLNRHGYYLGEQTDSELSDVYKGASDNETLVAADLFYLAMSDKRLIDSNSWTIDNRKADYVLYDSDMEERGRVTDPLSQQ